MSHLDVVRSDGVEERGPAVARVPEAVKEDHGGRLLNPRLEDHRLQRPRQRHLLHKCHLKLVRDKEIDPEVCEHCESVPHT